MHPGLEKIIEKIKQNPADQVLQDRYLSLVAELEDEDQKALNVLSLAKTLCKVRPLMSIELSQMVFRYDHGQWEALELMVQGLTELGRYGKAEVLRNELIKLKKLQITHSIQHKKKSIFLTTSLKKQSKKLTVPPEQPDSSIDLTSHHESSLAIETSMHGDLNQKKKY